MLPRDPIIVIVGALDTKGPDYEFLYEQLVTLSCKVVVINTGIRSPQFKFPIDVSCEEILGGIENLHKLRVNDNRAEAVKALRQRSN